MQSTFSGLNTMVNGIYTNRLSLNTVGHNISNSSTEGYSRQQAHGTATLPSEVYTLSGAVMVGNGSTISAVERARDQYTDRQYWKENGNDGYYNGKASNYSKIESIFNDSDNSGIQNVLEKFYEAWQDCSTTASTDTSRQNVINAGQNFAESLQTAAVQVKEQINSLYDDIRLSVDKVNSLTSQLVELNKNISGMEAAGAMANDLRDQRDLIVDQLSNIMNVNVYPNENGMYAIVSNGTTLVNGISKVDLVMSDPVNNNQYSLNDYKIMIKGVDVEYKPGSGELQAQFEAIDEDKGYIDQIADMAAFMLTTLNDQHKIGYGIDEAVTHGINFYGSDDYSYSWNPTDGFKSTETATGTVTVMKGMQIIDELVVNTKLTEKDGHKKLATRSMGSDGNVNGTGDGSNAVWVSTLFNCEQKNTDPNNNTAARSIGTSSLYSFYNTNMTTMGSDTSNMNGKVKFQKNVMTQVENLRDSTSGVNWDEELSNMIMFQQGYSACSRCLNAMDECLDKLVNGTGVVGR